METCTTVATCSKLLFLLPRICINLKVHSYFPQHTFYQLRSYLSNSSCIQSKGFNQIFFISHLAMRLGRQISPLMCHLINQEHFNSFKTVDMMTVSKLLIAFICHSVESISVHMQCLIIICIICSHLVCRCNLSLSIASRSASSVD